MAEFDPTKPVQTRDGRPARIICTDRKHSRDVIVALVTSDTTNDEHLVTYCASGQYVDSITDNVDLVNIPVRVSRYYNIYTTGDPCFHLSLECARRALHGNNYIGTIEVIREDGVDVGRKLHYFKEETRG